MALGTLTLSTTAGVRGRRFNATINGLTTGKVEVLNDGSPGFSVVNGRVMSQSLPYDISTVVLREYEPGVGQGYRDTRIDISAASAPTVSDGADGTVIIGGGGGAPTAKTATATASGPVYTYQRLLGSSSTIALVAGSNANLTLNTTSGVISATSAIGAGVSQTATVRESLAGIAVEVPITITGATPTPTPGPTPTPTPGYTAGPVNMALLGASRTRQNGQYINTANYLRTMSNSMGFVTWAEAIDNRIRYTNYTIPTGTGEIGGMQFGKDGQNMTDMLANVPAVLASDASWVLFDSSVGNVQEGASTYCAKAQDIITRLRPTMRARGGDVIWNVLIDRGLGAGWGATGDAIGSQNHIIAAQIRSQMKSWCDAQTPPVPYFDTVSIMLDTSTPDNMPFPEVFRDDRTHYHPIGAKRSGVAFAAFMAGKIGAAPAYDPSAAGNYITNAGLTGTGGTVPAGFEGGSVAPDGVTLSRMGTGSTAKVTTSVVTQNGRRGLLFTIDRSTMPSTGLSEGLVATFAHAPMANNLWWRFRARTEHSAASGIRTFQTRIRDNTGQETLAIGMTGINGAGNPDDGVNALYQDATATAVTPQTPPIRFANAANALAETRFHFDKGDGSTITAFVAVPELREVPNPALLNYDESLSLGASITSANAFSFAGDGISTRTVQFTGSKLGKWALSGADAGLWVIDAFGLATRTTPINYGSPDDADADRVDQLTVTLTPFDQRDSAVTQNVTVTATFADTGFSDAMTTAYPANTNLEANPGWTSDGVNPGGIQYTGGNNGIKLLNTTQAAWFATQQGDTVEQRISATLLLNASTAGFMAPLVLDKDNYLGIQGWTTTGFTVQRRIAGTSTTQCVFTSYKGSVVSSDAVVLQVRNIGGVYTLECFLNGVQLSVTSGSADVTSLVTGAGALAAARKSGIGTRQSSATVLYIRKWNNIRSYAQVSKNYLKALTWSDGATSFTAASATGSRDIANRSPLSGISFGSITGPTNWTGTIIPDGDTIRWDGLTSGTYTIPVIETAPDTTYVSNTRTSNLTLVIP